MRQYLNDMPLCVLYFILYTLYDTSSIKLVLDFIVTTNKADFAYSPKVLSNHKIVN